MTKVSQAELARIYSVSRKTITKWKAEGRLALSGKFVDLEETRARLARSATSRTKRVTSAVPDTALALPAAALGNADDALVLRPVDGAVTELIQDGPYSAGVTSGVSDLAASLPEIVARAAIATGIPVAAARALDMALRPLLTVRMNELFDAWQIDPFVHLVEEEEQAPILKAGTWAAHVWPADAFANPDWAKLEIEAAHAADR